MHSPTADSYYAVIFTSQLKTSAPGYDKMSEKMAELASKQPGYIGIESTRDPQTGQGITVSYWKDLDSIRQWKENLDHRRAQDKGQSTWYTDYHVRICQVLREYSKT
jgi:heme-degrading monooxygenase HmoA